MEVIQSVLSKLQETLSKINIAASGSLLEKILPYLSWAVRLLLLLLALRILTRCCRSLFGTKNEKEVWGFLSMANGARLELNHWENLIGRARHADVRLNLPTISRDHAALIRNDKGIWRIHPLQSRSNVRLYEELIYAPAQLQPGDVISLAGVDLHFFPASSDEEQAQAKKRTRPGRHILQGRTLRYLSAFQLFLIVEFFFAGAAAETLLPFAVSMAALCGLMWGLFAIYRAFSRTAFEVETLAFYLTSICFAGTAASYPSTLYKQLLAVIIGLFLFLCISFGLRNITAAVKLRWPVTIAASGLLAFNVLLGQRIFGAKNWVSIGPISFQPSELVKIAFILAGAATLDRLFAKRNLIFTALFSAYCVGCLALMSDFGTALIFFVAFLCIAFLRSGDLPSIAMLLAAAGAGGGMILRFKPYIANRFSVWGHVWENAQTTGYQQARTMSAIAGGGLFGVGPEKSWLKTIGAANTDLVFGVVSEQFGLLLALTMIAVLLILALFTVYSSAQARSGFYSITSCSAIAMLVFQATLNVFGSLDLLPLTGVTFPFVSTGGSSMMSCWAILAYIKAADTRQNAGFTLKLPHSKKAKVTAPPSEEITVDLFREEDDLF